MNEEAFRKLLKEELDPIRAWQAKVDCKFDPECEHYIMKPFTGMQENYMFAGKLGKVFGRAFIGLLSILSMLGGGWIVIEWLYHLLVPPKI